MVQTNGDVDFQVAYVGIGQFEMEMISNFGLSGWVDLNTLHIWLRIIDFEIQ